MIRATVITLTAQGRAGRAPLLISSSSSSPEVPKSSCEEDEQYMSRRAPEARDAIEIVGYGVLKAVNGESAFIAFCGCPLHKHAACDGRARGRGRGRAGRGGDAGTIKAIDCKKQRTRRGGASGKASTGRPIGFLIAWLMRQGAEDSRPQHCSHNDIPFAERRAARTFFNSLPGSATFLERNPEREVHPDESDSEPGGCC